MAGELSEIGIAREGLGHALKDNTLTVPVYQRSYKWTKENVEALIDDLKTAISVGAHDYFLGSVVVTKNDSGLVKVVDGQQRLATTSILIAAIRDYFYTNDDKEGADSIERDYLFTVPLRTREKIPKLCLNDTDRDYFYKRVLVRPDDPERISLVTPLKESHICINCAADLAARHVQQIARYRKGETSLHLLDWLDFLTDKARVIWFTVPDDENAFIIFETLNDRGLDLSVADLLKNYLFRLSGNRIGEVQQRWTSMIAALEMVSSKDISVMYIRHLWASHNGATREKLLYKGIREAIKTKQKALDLAGTLSDEAHLYAALLNPESDVWNGCGTTTRNHISTLKSFQAEQIRPLLLAVLSHFEQADIKRAMRMAVCWSVRFLIVGGGGGGLMEKNYSAASQAIRHGDLKDATALSEYMRQHVPTDAEFRDAFAAARVSQSHLARYYLRAMELTESDNPHPEMVPNPEEDEINLEHILPQNPGVEWEHISDDLAEALYKRIGNMVLLQATENAKIGRSGFEAKRGVFARSVYQLTSRVASNTEWGEEQIAERQKRLADIAVRTWPLIS